MAEPEVGRDLHGKVVKVVDFGAFVNFLGPRDGLVHISELAPQRVEDRRRRGQPRVIKSRSRCIGIDDRGKVKLSMKRG